MNLDENDNIQELESSWSLIKEQEEGYVFFSAGSRAYTWGERLWTIFSISLVLVLLLVMTIAAYEFITTKPLLGKLIAGGFAILAIVFLLKSLYEQLLEFNVKDQILELIDSNNHLVLTRDYLEVYWSPIKILKQKILIKNIESIDVEWQRFLLLGRKVPIAEVKERFAKDSSYESQGYSSFKVNLRNKKSKTLNFKLRRIDVAEQLSTYILSPQEFSTTDFKTNEEGTVIESEAERLMIYSSEPLLNEREVEESKGGLKSSMIFFIIIIALCVVTKGQIELLLIGSLLVYISVKNLYLLLKNARIKKIEVTPSLLTESRIGFKKKTEFSKEVINSFFVKQKENNNNYFISIILKEGVAYDLSIEFKERKTAEELIEKIEMLFANENKIPIDLESNASSMDSTVLEENSREELDNEKDAAG